MSRKLSIILLLCVAMLLPSIATAQFFAKQKVVVWTVMDRNNDVKVADATKTQIRTSIVDAFVDSRNYEAFEANINDVKARVGSVMSPINIAKAVKEDNFLKNPYIRNSAKNILNFAKQNKLHTSKNVNFALNYDMFNGFYVKATPSTKNKKFISDSFFEIYKKTIVFLGKMCYTMWYC